MKKHYYALAVLISLLTASFLYSCSSKGDKPKTKDEPTFDPTDFPTPFLKKNASIAEVDEWEKQHGGNGRQETHEEDMTQITFSSNKSPEIMRSYIFENEGLTQVISLWKPYTLIFEEQKETILKKEFVARLVANGYSNPQRTKNEYESINSDRKIRLIITPATLNSEVRDLVGRITFLFETKEDGGSTNDKNYNLDPIFPQLPVALCSNPDEILTAEKQKGSTVLKDQRTPVAGYYQQEFQVNEKIGNISILRRSYLTNAKNSMLQIAQIVVAPEEAYWKEGVKDINPELVRLIKSQGYIDTGLDKAGETHFFYKEESMQDGRNYTQVQIQRLNEGRYPEINIPTIGISISRTDIKPFNVY